jgi:hypothetical protein
MSIAGIGPGSRCSGRLDHLAHDPGVLADLADAGEAVLLESSTVALNRKRPCASRPAVTSEIASTSPPPRWAICSSAPSSAARAIP